MNSNITSRSRTACDFHEAFLLGLTWPPWYTMTVWRRASSLQWRESSRHAVPITGVTYVELLVHLVVHAGVFPPKRLMRNGREEWVDVTSEAGLLLPVNIRDALKTLTSTVQALGRHMHVNLFPGQKSRHIKNLCCFPGEPPGRKGLLLRPCI